jgi:copper(I)-binding protein
LLVNLFRSSVAAVPAVNPRLGTRLLLRAGICAVLCAAPLRPALATATGAEAGTAHVAHAMVGLAAQPAHGIAVSGAWARATPPGVRVTAAYMTITNRGARPDVLVGASSPAAAAVQLHRTSMENGMARMRPAGTISLAPGTTLRVEPGGLHWMLHGLRAPLAAGQTLALTLRFRDAGDITVQLAARAATHAPARQHAGH